VERFFDHIIIGNGLVGSAAAKYLATAGRNIAVIGPSEPAPNQKSLVYASHYDQARIQRMIGKDLAWTRLNVDSVRAYPEIERKSGIRFHQPVGCLYVNPYGKDDYLEAAPIHRSLFGLEYTSYTDANELKRAFAGFTFPASAHGLFEADPAGYIQPRKLIQAQNILLKHSGGMNIQDIVIGMDQDSAGRYEVITQLGKRYKAQSVCLATGSFLNHMDLLPKPPVLLNKSEVVLLVKTDADTFPSKPIPSLLYELNTKEIDGIYLIPPVAYEDEKQYLKIGCNTHLDTVFTSIDEIREWFDATDPAPFFPLLANGLRELMPAIRIGQYEMKKCIISRTPHGRPYIGETRSPGLFIAGGCNGYSAMSSDAIGKVLAFQMLHGGVPMGYSADDYELIYP
jgi:glycine/D-amino acid oxidase-like deaminating enzyme